MGKRKLVLLSDVHGNREALLSILVWLWQRQSSLGWELSLIVLGDSVNYCADSEAVLRIFRILKGESPLFYEAAFIEMTAQGWPKESERGLIRAALFGLFGSLTVMIKGDHEDLVLGYDEVSSFGADAKADLAYTRGSLSVASLVQAYTLPTHVLLTERGQILRSQFEIPGRRIERISAFGPAFFHVVHGLPQPKVTYTVKANGGTREVEKPGWRDGYLFPDAKKLELIQAAKAVCGKICFLGQTHKAMCVLVDLGKEGVERIELEWGIPVPVVPSFDQVFFINPGSVGQPRDGQSDMLMSVKTTSFGLYDLDARTFTNVRIPYPIEETQRLMREAGLSERNIARLALGR